MKYMTIKIGHPPQSCLLLKPIVNNELLSNVRTLQVYNIQETKTASIFKINASQNIPAVKGLNVPGIPNKSGTQSTQVCNTPDYEDNNTLINNYDEEQKVTATRDLTNNLPYMNDIGQNRPEHDVAGHEIFPTRIEDKYQPKGYEIPIFSQIEDIINLDEYSPLQRKYVKDIFVDKYSDIISRHAYHVGNISDSLGFIKLELKQNASLPPFKRIYYLQEVENQHLKDILDYLVAADVIVRCGINDGGPFSGFASPAYIVEKQCPERSSFRLIVNFQFLNSQMFTSPPVLPSMTKMLQNLHGMYLFSNFDLSSAFYCLTLEKDSRPITKFTCAQGTYMFKRLPMGLNRSPEIFCAVGEKIINYKPIFDKKGNPKRDENNVVQLENAPIPNCSIFFDDILVYSRFQGSLEQTYKNHFETIEQVMQRLHFHKCKLSWNKTKLCKTSIRFLGWIIEQNKIRPDPDRIEKLLNTPFPATKKGQRSFLGLLNTLRQISPGDFVAELSVLSPLTSTKAIYKPEKKHMIAFEKIKKLLTTTPLYTTLIDPAGKFYLFSDASTSENSSYSAVLCQVQQSKQIYVPTYFNLVDPIHNLLFKNEQEYRPIPLYLSATSIPKTKCGKKIYNPALDVDYFSDKYLNYGDQYENSLFIAIRSILYHYQAKFPDEMTLRSDAVKNIKSSISYFQLKDEIFEKSTEALKDFLQKFSTSRIPGDDGFHIVRSLAEVLKRQIIIIIQNQPFKTAFRYFFEKDQKPPIILGCYKTSHGLIYRPFVSTHLDEFDLQEFQNRLQICYFYSKSIPQSEKSKCILTLEIQGILHALEYFKPLLRLSQLTVLTDSRAFFCLFARRVQKHHVVIQRYCDRMRQSFPQIKLKFLISEKNIADFLSRQHTISTKDYKRIPLKYFQVSKHIVQTIDEEHEYTLAEWENFVGNNENLLTTNEPNPEKKKLSVYAITKHDVQYQRSHYLAGLLAQYINRENIEKEQKIQFTEIIQKCIASPKFEAGHNGTAYFLNNNLLMSRHKNIEKIVLPDNLQGPFLVLRHILQAHCGKARLHAAANPYHIEHLDTKIRKLLGSCYDCILVHSTKNPTYGRVPIASYAGKNFALDLLEDLPPSMRYTQVLIIADMFSNYVLTFPLRKKTANEVLIPVLFLIHQHFQVVNIVSDNGACFKQKQFLHKLKMLKINKIFLSPRNPQANGLIEKNVHIIKSALRKYLASDDKNDWVQKLPIITKAYNCSPNPLHGFSPLQVLYGQSSPNAVNSFFSNEILQNNFPNLSPIEVGEEINHIAEIVRKTKLESQDARLQTKNKNLANPQYQLHDYCLIKDFYRLAGTTRPLKTKYSAAIYVVVKVNSRSLILQNLTTGTKSLNSMRHVKKIQLHDLSNIPLSNEIKTILQKDFIALTKQDIIKISKDTKIVIQDPPSDWLLKDDAPYPLDEPLIDTLEDVDDVEAHDDDDQGPTLRPRVRFKYTK